MEKILMDKQNKMLRIYDILLGVMVFLLAAAVAMHKLFFEDASLAVLNLFLSLIPAGYLLISKMPKKMNNKTLPLFIIIFVRVITSVMSFNSLETYDILVQCCYDISLIVNVLGIYLVLENTTIRGKFKFNYINYALIVSTLIYSIYNIAININNYTYFTNPKYLSLVNFSSFFENRNLFGVMLLLGLFAVYYESETNKSRWLKVVKCFLILNILLTLSRNSVLSFIVFWTVKAIIDKKYRKIIILFILVAAVLIINIFGIRGIISTYLIRSDAMTSGRTSIWEVCISQFLKSPLIGYGELYISSMINSITGITSMHSWFFKVLLNGGIINALCYIIIIANTIISLIKSAKDKVEYSNIALPAVFAIIVYGIFEEINLFEFGLINMGMTFFAIILPKITNNHERGDKVGQDENHINCTLLQ